jgi:hypothetical protein
MSVGRHGHDLEGRERRDALRWSLAGALVIAGFIGAIGVVRHVLTPPDPQLEIRRREFQRYFRSCSSAGVPCQPPSSASRMARSARSIGMGTGRASDWPSTTSMETKP